MAHFQLAREGAGREMASSPVSLLPTAAPGGIAPPHSRKRTRTHTVALESGIRRNKAKS